MGCRTGFARALSHPRRTRGPPAPHLEVGFAQDAGQLGGRAVLPRQVPDVTQDLLHQLQVVVPHRLQLRLLQPLVGLMEGIKGGGLGTPVPPTRSLIPPASALHAGSKGGERDGHGNAGRQRGEDRGTAQRGHANVPTHTPTWPLHAQLHVHARVRSRAFGCRGAHPQMLARASPPHNRVHVRTHADVPVNTQDVGPAARARSTRPAGDTLTRAHAQTCTPTQPAMHPQHPPLPPAHAWSSLTPTLQPGTRRRAHTRVPTCTLASTRAREHAHAPPRVHAHACVHASTPTCESTSVRAHGHAHVRAYTHARARARRRRHAQPPPCMHPRTCKRTSVYGHACTFIHPYPCTCTRTHAGIHEHLRASTPMCIFLHASTHVHAHTCAPVHAYPSPLPRAPRVATCSGRSWGGGGTRCHPRVTVPSPGILLSGSP